MLSVYGKLKKSWVSGILMGFSIVAGAWFGCGGGFLPVRAASVMSEPLLSSATSSAADRVVPNDPYWSRQWYLRQIGADRAWTVTTGTKKMIVAVIDAGVDITHPDLADTIWTNPREYAADGVDNDRNGFMDDTHGWNFVTNRADVRPLAKPLQSEEAWSHGTMIASLIGAKGNNGVGMSGVAWNVQIMPLVALDADGSGSTEDIIQAIRYAVSMGASVINLSLAGYEEDPALTEMIHRAYSAGVIVVVANGNSEDMKAGVNIDITPSYPTCGERGEDAVIGVGGTDALDQKAGYANYGKQCTDLSAPAYDLFAARPSYSRASHSVSVNVPNYRDGVIGTSLAAPLVSGAIVLLKSVHPNWSPQQIQARLYATADPLFQDQTPGSKTSLGYGRLNIGRALLDPLPVVSVTVPVPKATTVTPVLVPKKVVPARLPSAPPKLLHTSTINHT